MEKGGCMEESDELYCLPVNLESKFDEVATPSPSTSSEIECCICYETIGEKNNCVTECGHKFCLKCLVTSLLHNNGCPYCRTPVFDVPNEEEDEDDDEDASEGDDDSDDGEEFSREYDGHVEDVVERLQKQGITMLDVVSLLFDKYSKKDEKYTNDYIRKLGETVDQINEDVERESAEIRDMGAEDILA
jgi:hypothetical protein